MTSPIDGEAPTEHEVPSPASQKLEIDALQLSEPMKEGDAWYLIEAKWWQSWKEYVNMLSSSPPGPIDNSPLLNDKNELLVDVSERNDFILLPERTWEKLLSWYGGGPVIGRKVIKTRTSTLSVEIRPLVVNVVYNKETFPIEISKADTTGKLKEIICREKNLNADEVRVWDYYENRKLKVLSDLDERIDDAQILHQQSLLVEAKNADGSWPEEDKRFNDYYGSNSLYGNNNRRPTKPGLTGLNNLGNTCFMNSSLQCLSNTIPLTQFFITNEYAKDINTDNPLGMKGRLAEEFARLVRELWSGQNIAVAPREFKSKLEGFAPQFSGYQQHDSQELLAFLLDGLHEDLNRIKKKQYVEMKEADGRSDDEVAREAWGLHKSRNDSIVVDWFQGQLKSTLVCPECNKISVTFDPFMYLSLPLPMKTTRTVVVTFFPIDGSKPPTKYGVKLPKFGTIANLKSGLAELCGIPAEGLVVTEVYNSRFFKKFNDSDAVDGIQDRDIIHAYEIYVPTESESDWEVLYCPVYQLRDGGGYSYQRKTLFGMPFIISLTPKNTYQALYQQILQYVQRYLKVSVEDLLGEQPESQSSDDVMSLDGQQSQTEMADASSSGYASDDSDGMDDSDEDSHLVIKKNKGVSRENPARTSNNSRLFELLSVDSYGQNERPIIDDGRQLDLEDRQHLAIYWNPAFFSKVYDSDLEKEIKEHPSAREDDPEANSDITLDKCLELFAATERLGPDDPWYCNKCKEHRQATKKFDLWSAPPVLVIHLKRFSYRNKYWREKLETQVNYPLRGLDLTNHLISKPANAPIYDLYAVSNHYGSMGGGHYTAYALNKETNKWYKFDDSYVTEVEESHVVSSSAYVLFYRRRDSAVPVPNEVSNNNNNGSPSNTTTTTTSSYADDDTDEDM